MITLSRVYWLFNVKTIDDPSSSCLTKLYIFLTGAAHHSHSIYKYLIHYKRTLVKNFELDLFKVIK